MLSRFSFTTFPLRWVGRTGWNHGKAHFGALFAADHIDNLPQLHVDNVHRRFLVLGHFDDLVPWVQLVAHVRRTSGNELLNDAVAVLISQKSADTDQRILHGDRKVVQGIGGEESGVRIIHLGEGGEEEFLNIVWFQLLNVAPGSPITANHLLFGAFQRLIIKYFLE